MLVFDQTFAGLPRLTDLAVVAARTKCVGGLSCHARRSRLFLQRPHPLMSPGRSSQWKPSIALRRLALAIALPFTPLAPAGTRIHIRSLTAFRRPHPGFD